MINNRAMPVLLSARRVATHHRSSTPTVNDFAGALGCGRHWVPMPGVWRSVRVASGTGIRCGRWRPCTAPCRKRVAATSDCV